MILWKNMEEIKFKQRINLNLLLEKKILTFLASSNHSIQHKSSALVSIGYIDFYQYHETLQITTLMTEFNMIKKIAVENG